VDKIDGTVTVAELKAEFASPITVKKDDTEKDDDKFVATDDVIFAGTDSLRALIYGDVDRNGKVTLTDVSGAMKHIAKWNPDINTDAADVDKSGSVNLLDAAKLLKQIAGWDDISLGNVRLVFENTKLTAEHEAADLDLYFETPLIKHPRSDTKNTGRNSYKIKMARREYESCQFYLTSDVEMEGLTLELTPFVHEYDGGTLTAEILFHHYYKFVVPEDPFTYHPIDNPGVDDYYPEPLLPMADSFELHTGQSQGFHINVYADENAPAGMYKATLNVKNSAGKIVKTADVYTYVWDFTLPVTPYSASAFSINWYNVHAYTPGISGGDDSATYAKYYEYLLDNNVTPYTMPYKITDPRADAIMDDPRVTYFTVAGGDNFWPTAQSAEEVVAFYNKIKDNPLWMDKAAFYLVDEPYGTGGAQKIVEMYTALTELLGTDNYQAIMPFGNSMVDTSKCIDVVEFIRDWVDIFCPNTLGFRHSSEETYSDGMWTPRQAFNKYGESLPRLQALKYEHGKKLWWYICCSPQFPHPNLFLVYQGVMNRVVWWQQFMFDSDGILYWCVNGDWGNLPTKHRHNYNGNGDGNLIYCGEQFGFEGPVNGWRFVHVRDGFDDFDYLRMAEELCGRETVLDVVHRLTTAVTILDQDPAVMEACRDTIAEMIVEAGK